jgi:zinc finger protein 830
MSAGSRTITDRLARYDAAGNLTCLVCKTSISHDALWKAHVLGKEHLHAIEALKQKKAQSAPAAASVARPAATTAPKFVF